MPPHLEQLEARVRQCAVSRRYQELVEASAEFAEAVRAYTQLYPKSDARSREAVRRLMDLLTWSLVIVHGSRAACAAQLRRVKTANRYARRDGEPSRAPGIDLDA